MCDVRETRQVLQFGTRIRSGGGTYCAVCVSRVSAVEAIILVIAVTAHADVHVHFLALFDSDAPRALSGGDRLRTVRRAVAATAPSVDVAVFRDSRDLVAVESEALQKDKKKCFVVVLLGVKPTIGCCGVSSYLAVKVAPFVANSELGDQQQDASVDLHLRIHLLERPLDRSSAFVGGFANVRHYCAWFVLVFRLLSDASHCCQASRNQIFDVLLMLNDDAVVALACSHSLSICRCLFLDNVV